MARPLDELQDEILGRLHAGQDLDRDAILAANPEHTEALRGFFALLELIESEPAPAPPMPSRLGEFVILREIGRGGMGVVYEAEQPSLRRKVALKVLPPAGAGDVHRLTRFRREAEAAARLRHPHIVPVFSVGQSADMPFFAMELVEGRSLAEILARRREGLEDDLPPAGEPWRRWCLSVAADIGDALAYAHRQGILHRDVKPGNILIQPDGTPRLTDFGLALDVRATAVTQSSAVFGSPLYMSPEQLFRREAPLDERTDIYSLGVTLYEMLTLRLPYVTDSRADLFNAIAEQRIVPLRSVDPDAEPALERVLLHSLRRDPRERYPDASLLAADLRALLEHRVPSQSRSRRRWPVLAASIVAVLVLAYFVAGYVQRLRYASQRGFTPTRAEVERLAAGADPDGSSVLARWVQPSVRLRQVVAREGSSPIKMHVRAVLPQESSDAALCWRWERSLDDGPWEPIGHPDWCRFLLWREKGDVGGEDVVEVADLLGPKLSSEIVRLRLRAVFTVATRIEYEASHDASTPKAETRYEWTSDGHSLCVYDSYPPDYPTLVSNPAVDDAMRETLGPSYMYFTGEIGSVEATDEKLLQLVLVWEAARDLPESAACSIEIQDPSGGEKPIAFGTFSRRAVPSEGAASHRTRRSESHWFRLALVGEAQARLLLALRAERLETVRMVFRPSRDVALGEPDFDSYWGGTAEFNVPLRRP